MFWLQTGKSILSFCCVRGIARIGVPPEVVLRFLTIFKTVFSDFAILLQVGCVQKHIGSG